MVCGFVAVVAALGWAVAAERRQRVVALNPTFRPEADDGSGRTLRLIGVHSIEDFAAAMRVAYGRPVQVHWKQIELAQGRRLEFVVPEVDVANAFRLVNAQMLQLCPTIAWRTFPTHVEIGDRSYFDRMELERREYDLTGVVRAWRAASTEDNPSPCADMVVRKAVDVVEIVQPQSWKDQGGDLANIEIAGATLIIDAPRSMHAGIERQLRIYEQAAHRAILTNTKVEVKSCFGRSSPWDGGIGP
jgi:hypothetical protein